MSNPKFSIVIPIYNAESTIARTIASLKEFDFTDYEVLLINDGSTDQTEAIITRLIENDPKFRLITTANQGPGLARNEGIMQAKELTSYFLMRMIRRKKKFYLIMTSF